MPSPLPADLAAFYTVLRDDQAARLAKPFHHQIDGSAAVLVPTGYTVHQLPPKPLAPSHLAGIAVLQDIPSLVAYVKRFAAAQSPALLYYTDKAIRVILNPPANGQPSYADHVAELPFTESAAFSAWRNAAAHPLGQREFAQHIEDWLPTIAKPDGAELLAAVSVFAVQRDLTFEAKADLARNTTNFTYRENDKPLGTVSLPTAFTLCLPLYAVNDAPVTIPARLSYSITRDTGVLSFRFRLPAELDDTLRAERVAIAAAVGEALDLQPLAGAIAYSKD
jgi:uncharacterized protein YfdQ (DUF2303 family)